VVYISSLDNVPPSFAPPSSLQRQRVSFLILLTSAFLCVQFVFSWIGMEEHFLFSQSPAPSFPHNAEAAPFPFVHFFSFLHQPFPVLRPLLKLVSAPWPHHCGGCNLAASLTERCWIFSFSERGFPPNTLPLMFAGLPPTEPSFF